MSYGFDFLQKESPVQDSLQIEVPGRIVAESRRRGDLLLLLVGEVEFRHFVRHCLGKGLERVFVDFDGQTLSLWGQILHVQFMDSLFQKLTLGLAHFVLFEGKGLFSVEGGFLEHQVSPQFQHLLGKLGFFSLRN